MSTRDGSGLSDHERMELAGLEQKAQADDPVLAELLRQQAEDEGGGRGRFQRTLRAFEPPGWTRTLWFGLLLVVAGLVVTIAMLTVSVPAAAVACIVIATGLSIMAHYLAKMVSRAVSGEQVDGDVDQPAA